MTSIFDTYAAKVCRHLDLPPDTYGIATLNSYIMTLPLGEAHAALQDVDLADLPRLGDTVSLKDHMHTHFFSVLHDPSRNLFEFTVPILIRRQHLERLEGWRDWRTLSVYLGQEGLEPSVVFRNTPIALRTQGAESVDHYAADIRVVFVRDEPYLWQG